MTNILPIWTAAGLRLVDPADGRLVVGDDYLRAYLVRPELLPVQESCAYERQLHESLMQQPRQPLTPVGLLRIKDKDARENYEIFAHFRDHLLASKSIEQAYLRLFEKPDLQIPSLFIDQLTHLVLAGILRDERDPFRLRAAECLFREQRVTHQEGAIFLADQETLEQSDETAGLGSIGRLLVDAQAPIKQPELDVLSEANANGYTARSGRFDMVMDATFGRPALDALARVLEAWIERFYPVGARIQPVAQIRDERWIWHIGLDRQSTEILNDLFEGETVEDSRLERLISLFRLDIDNPSLLIERVRGRPIYLGVAHDPDGRLRMKPQNLLVNLPLMPQN